MKYNTHYRRRFNRTIESSTEVNYLDLVHLSRWDFFVERFVCCMTPQVAQAQNVSIGEHRHCCATFKT